MLECPRCGETRSHLIAIHGKIKTISCMSCGQGWKSGITGKKRYREVFIDFQHMVDRLVIMCGKRKIRLQAIKIQPDFGGFATDLDIQKEQNSPSVEIVS